MGRRHNKSGVADVIRAFQMTDNLHLAADVVDELCGISYTARRSVKSSFIYHVISTSLGKFVSSFPTFKSAQHCNSYSLTLRWIGSLQTTKFPALTYCRVGLSAILLQSTVTVIYMGMLDVRITAGLFTVRRKRTSGHFADRM